MLSVSVDFAKWIDVQNSPKNTLKCDGPGYAADKLQLTSTQGWLYFLRA